VKYNTFHKEASKKLKNDIIRIQNWTYDEEKDEYTCGYGRILRFLNEKKQKTHKDTRAMSGYIKAMIVVKFK
jgi:hypothetical protein